MYLKQLLELLFEIDALDTHFGEIWSPLALKTKKTDFDLFAPVLKLKSDELKEIWQEAYEYSFYDQVVFGIKTQQSSQKENTKVQFQALFLQLL